MMSEKIDLLDENLGQLIREHRGRYLTLNVISRRVRQLQTGKRSLALPADGSRESVRVAIQEVLEDKLEVVPHLYGYLDGETEGAGAEEVPGIESEEDEEL
jgi:DNA-directed RNA polymerase subunit K/omega